MLSLDLGDHTERYGDLREALLIGHLRELRIKVCPLLVLASSGCRQILGCRTDNTSRISRRDLYHAALEELEETLSVLFLLLRCLHEDTGDLLITLFLGRAREECVTASCLRLTRE